MITIFNEHGLAMKYHLKREKKQGLNMRGDDFENKKKRMQCSVENNISIHPLCTKESSLC